MLVLKLGLLDEVNGVAKNLSIVPDIFAPTPSAGTFKIVMLLHMRLSPMAIMGHGAPNVNCR